MKPLIETFTGVGFTPLAPKAEDIRIEDIAHALANQARFSGHTRFRYSVAEHSVRVSELLEDWGEPRRVLLWGLLHDAAEAFLVDLPTPLKIGEFGEAYRAAEGRLMAAVCQRFGISKKEPLEVRDADATLLATEARDLMFYRPVHWEKVQAWRPLKIRIRPWSADVAEFEFLRRFEQLGGTAACRRTRKI